MSLRGGVSHRQCLWITSCRLHSTASHLFGYMFRRPKSPIRPCVCTVTRLQLCAHCMCYFYIYCMFSVHKRLVTFPFKVQLLQGCQAAITMYKSKEMCTLLWSYIWVLIRVIKSLKTTVKHFELNIKQIYNIL